MKGTIYRRGESWSWQLTTGSKARDDRKHHSKGGFRTRKECQAALTQVLAKLGQGDESVLVKPVDTPLGDYLTGWLEARRSSSSDALKPTTVSGYADAIRAWVRPHVGLVPLSRVSSATLLGLYAELRVKGSRCRKCDATGTLAYQAAGAKCPACAGVGGRPLGDRSVMLVHTLLTMALADAVEAGHLAVNPVLRIPRRQRPTYTQRKQADRHWDAEEARRFLASTADDRLHPLYALALDTGARRGELAALRWTDVDLDEGTVSIERSRVHVGDQVVETTPKSAKSHRTVDIDGRTVAVLRAWRAVQQQDRLAAGPAWAGGPLEAAYLFTDEAGAAYRPDGLSDRFEKAVAAAGVPRIPFHGLRHTSATILLAAGVPVHVVSERLGHANVGVTLTTYAHVLPKQGSDAARIIGGLLYGDATGTDGGAR